MTIEKYCSKCGRVGEKIWAETKRMGKKWILSFDRENVENSRKKKHQIWYFIHSLPCTSTLYSEYSWIMLSTTYLNDNRNVQISSDRFNSTDCLYLQPQCAFERNGKKKKKSVRYTSQSHYLNEADREWCCGICQCELCNVHNMLYIGQVKCQSQRYKSISIHHFNFYFHRFHSWKIRYNPNTFHFPVWRPLSPSLSVIYGSLIK